MTKKELLEAIKDQPDDTEICIGYVDPCNLNFVCRIELEFGKIVLYNH